MRLNLTALALASALALMPVGTAQMKTGDSSVGMMKSMQSLEKRSGKSFDIAFMSQMIAHHEGAVEMAKSVLENGKKDFVKKAAQQVIADQTKEVKQLTGWLKSWYRAAPDAKQMALVREDMQPMMTAAMGDMPGMNMSPDPDKSFLESMVPHHQGAIDMSKLALKKASRAELKTFARGVITAQTKEIAQYKAWLKTWK